MRDFLKKLELIRVSTEIVPDATLSKEIIKVKESPILLTNIKNYSTQILAGIVSSRELLAKAINISPKGLSDYIEESYKNPLPLKKVNTAPFLKNHFKSPNIIEFLPIPEFYGGKRYLTASIVLALHPETGRRNASIHRMMYIKENKFCIRPVPQRDLHNFYTTALEKGKEHLDIIILIGVHPAFELAASTSYPELDEFQFASRLLGGADEYVLKGIGIPINAEIVMVGKMLKEMHEEGPFIDLTGTEDHIRMQPVVEITDLFLNDNPIFRTILPGMREHKTLMGIPQEPRIQRLVKNTIPTVKQVIMTEGGGSWLHAVVQIQKRTNGDGKNAILAALAAHPSLKRVVIVDEDINPTDPIDVEWAIATRFQADRDLLLVPGCKGSSLDPSAGKMSTTCKWGMDCTKPIGGKGFDKIIQ